MYAANRLAFGFADASAAGSGISLLDVVKSDISCILGAPYILAQLAIFYYLTGFYRQENMNS